MKYLALITARAGSKRIPEKNIKLLNGRPLVWYTLDALHLANDLFDTIAITTESPMIMTIAQMRARHIHPKGLVPIARPESLAQDTTEHIQVLAHALWQFNVDQFDAIMTLQPTSPLRATTHIREAIQMFEENGCKNLVSVNPEGIRNAAIYITPVKEMFEPTRTKIYNPDSIQYQMDKESSTDINTVEDWMIAEEILRDRHR